MSLPSTAATKWLPQATLSKGQPSQNIVVKQGTIQVTTSNDVGPIMKGVFMAAPSGVVKRATTGDTITGWVASVPTGSLGTPLQAQYFAAATAGQVSVLDLSLGPVFEMIDNTSTYANTILAQAIAAGVAIDSESVKVDIVNGTDVTDTASPGTIAPAPIGSVLLKSDTYGTSTAQIQILGLSPDPGNTAAPFKYLCRVFEYS